MPALIFEQFYMKVLIINMTRKVQKLFFTNGTELTIEAYLQCGNFRVSGELDTLGNIHAVYGIGPIIAPEQSETNIRVFHQVGFEGVPHVTMGILWLLDKTASKEPPWDRFNVTMDLRHLEDLSYPIARKGFIKFRDLAHQSWCLTHLKGWACVMCGLPEAPYSTEYRCDFNKEGGQ